MEAGEVKGIPSLMGLSDTPDCLGRMEPLATKAHRSCTGSSRSREILKNPVFMRVLRRGKTYENP